MFSVALGLTCRAEITLCVSPFGNDANTGALKQPLATLESAKEWIRAQKLAQPVSVVFEDGAYELNRPVVFSSEDSGTESAPIVYKARNPGKVVFSGGRRIAGWSEKEFGVWVAPVESGQEFYQLFVNGERRQRARFPNSGYLKSFGPSYPVENYGAITREDASCYKEFRFRQGDFRGWDDLADALVVYYHSWLVSLHWVDRVNAGTGVVYLRNESAWPFGKWDNQQERYYIENVRAAFDAQGEWFLDKKAGELLYRPLPGEDMQTAEVTVPVLQRLLEFRDVEHLAFEGLSFQYTDWRLDKDSFRDQQAFANVDSASVFGRGLRHSRFENCEIAHAGAHAVVLREGCQYNIFHKCHIHDMAGGGVYIGSTAFIPSGTPDSMLSYSNVVDNCFIHNLNHTFHGAVGVFIGMSAGNRITHNDISESDYTGISAGWTWKREDKTYHHDNRIENNHVHHLMQGVLSDGGGIYTAGYHHSGTVIRGNVVHDIQHHPTHCSSKGIYLDGCSSGILVENNLCYNISSFGIQAKGERNRIRNNIFAWCGEAGISRDRAHEDKTPDSEYGTNEFLHNIVLQSYDVIIRGLVNPPMSLFRSNLYWNVAGAGQSRFFYRPSEWSQENRLMTFDEFKFSGQGEGSLEADPGFENIRQRNFHLKPGSPATSVGFIPFDYSDAGLYGDADWVSAPERLTHRPVEQVPVDWTGFKYDFEDHYVGMAPMTCWIPAERGGCTVRVSRDRSFSGGQSLLFQDGNDAPGFFPNLIVVQPYPDGLYRLSMRLWNDPDSPASINIQTRSHMGKGYLIGADVALRPDGTLTAGGQTQQFVPSGEWILFELTFGGGAACSKTYDVKLTRADGSSLLCTLVPARDAGFENLGWIGILANGKVGRFYLDDLKLERVEE